MQRPESLKTRIFLDSGDPAETREALSLLGFLDGQTTNPTLVARHPEVRERLARAERFREEEAYALYRRAVMEMSELLPEGSVSVEVFADQETPPALMLEQSLAMAGWIPNAHIKFPIVESGLACAEEAIRRGVRVNMTLCFSQEQAAAVGDAVREAGPGQAFISPFVGRLDDAGLNGLDLIANCVRMYREDGRPVQVLAASIRSYRHFLGAIACGADIVTAPILVLREWAAAGRPMPEMGRCPETEGLQPIPYRPLDLSRPWREAEIAHELTDRGLSAFVEDWKGMIG